MQLRISGIIEESVVDGPGIRFVVFTQGCFHKCIQCHNQATHDPEGGRLIEIEELLQMIKKNPLLDGVTFSGGEPLLHTEALTLLAKECHQLGLNVISYTGFIWEDLMKNKKHFADYLSQVDVLIDGPFKIELKSLNLSFRGSSNQRIIDVQKSLKSDDLVLLDW
ncbi:MAG: anaerobic ribonucleoside-triphosphate reductase activating protein [Bacillales bacterium]|jgi:anaerobic ribonucleoside-triphosphate reductase activating protein|nr:anaerobic ribonucleoside-triphosphate reductase activating protein [Bacillales bacterium]